MIERILEPEVMDGAVEAAEYDAMDHSAVNEALVARLIELGATGRTLDIGTGPGRIPILACERIEGLSAVGIDLSPAMIALAKRHRLASTCSDRLEFRVLDARRLRFRDASFDTVVCNGMLHHLADPRPLLEEARRVLKRGGTLLVRDLRRPESIEQLEGLVGLHARGATQTQRDLFAASLQAAFTPTELRIFANDTGLREARVVPSTDRHVSLEIAAL